MTTRSNTHGGRRVGAGRKKGSVIKEPTTVMRIPESQKPVITDFLAAYRRRQSAPLQDQPMEFERPIIAPAKRSWPLFSSKVVVDGEFTIKLLAKTKQGGPRLLPSNQSGEYKPIEIKDGMQFEIWGVVTGSFRRFK